VASPSMTGTPRASALVTLDPPGLSPATRAAVFFETEPVALPPRSDDGGLRLLAC
jgi:hypothetical protein